jgi:hypothetical protein
MIATTTSSARRSLQTAIAVLRRHGLDATVIRALQEDTFEPLLLNLPLTAGEQVEVEIAAPHTMRVSFYERDARGMAVPVWVRHYGQSGQSRSATPWRAQMMPTNSENHWARLA